MNVCFLDLLRCPLCGGKLTVKVGNRERGELSYGVLKCYCSLWPVVDGIPIFRKRAEDANDALIASIEAGRFNAALETCLSIRYRQGGDGRSARIKHSVKSWLAARQQNSWLRLLPGMETRLKEFTRLQKLSGLLNPRTRITVRDNLQAYFFDRMGAYYHFFHLFSQPRHLVALSIVDIIHQPNRPLLDLACGFGHVTRALLARAEGQPVIGMDISFFALYVARHYVAPQAEFLCCDANKALPFPKSTFAAAICSDAFHDFAEKTTCIQECERLTRDNGFFALIWVRNAQVWPTLDGLSLPLEGYRDLIAHMPHRLLSSRSALAGYLQKMRPSLEYQADPARLANEPTFSLVMSHDSGFFKDYGPLLDWPHAYGNLSLNPLYIPERTDAAKTILLRREIPPNISERLDEEIKEYLPERIYVSPAALEDLARHKRTKEVEGLVERCVVLGLPEAYY